MPFKGLEQIGLINNKLDEAAKGAAEKALRDGLAFSKGFTDATQPPASGDSNRRKAHPGQWSDVTSNLVNSMNIAVIEKNGEIIGEYFAGMEYASDLQGKKRKEGGTYSIFGDVLEGDDFSTVDEFVTNFEEAFESLK